MSDKERLDIACMGLRQAIRNGNLNNDYRKRWAEFASRGSVQARRARQVQNSSNRFYGASK